MSATGPVDIRSLLLGGLNTAMMAAFSYHPDGQRFVDPVKAGEREPMGPGAKIGVVIAVAVLLVELLYPNTAPPDPDPVATQKDVKNALDGLVGDVIDAEWGIKLSDVVADLAAQRQGFHDMWSGLSGIMLSPNGEFDFGASKNDVGSLYQYFNPLDPTELLMVLRKYRYALEDGSLNDSKLTSEQLDAHQIYTVGLYGLIGSLTCAYLKACVAWAWAREQQMTYRYELYQAAKKDPAKAPTAETDYPDVNASTGYSPLGWNEFVVTPGSSVGILKSEAQAMLDFAAGLLAIMDPPPDPYDDGDDDDDDDDYPPAGLDLEGDWSAFDGAIAGYDVVPSAAMTQAEMIAAVEKGVDRSNNWAAEEMKYATLLFSKNVEAWKAMWATVRFETYQVAAGGEYLDDIAKRIYGDDNHTMDLFQANIVVLDYDVLYPYLPEPPPQWARGPQVNAGTLLRIFETDALSYIVNPPQAA